MDDFVTISLTLPKSRLLAVYAFLGGASAAAFASSGAGNAASAKQDTTQNSGTAATLSPESPASAGSGQTAANTASPSEGPEGVDAHGHPWSADLHASTGNKTKDGLWRMKVGVTRPEPMPGFPKDASTGATSTPTNGTGAPAAATATGANAGGSPEAEEEDEFAAFRAAAASTPAPAATARNYTDADLAVLCNDAAVKLGDPAPVKALIAEYVPADQVKHSRNVPTDQRAAFVAAVEAKAGITFAG